MYERYKTDAPLTAGNARYLAQRLGAEHVFSNRTVFNMVANQLFGGYAEAIRQPIDNNWRRMPSVALLVEAAEEGFREASSTMDQARLSRLGVFIRQKFAEVFWSAVPKLDVVSADPTVIILPRVVTELMEMRDKAVISAARQSKGLIGNFFADRKAEAIHNRFLSEASDSDLSAAFSVVAERNMEEVLAEVYDNELATRMTDDTRSLVTVARALGGTVDSVVLRRLSQVDAMIEDFQSAAGHVPAPM